MKIRDDEFGFQAQIGAFGAESRRNQAGAKSSWVRFDFYKNMANLAFKNIASWTEIPDDVLSHFQDFLQNPKHESEKTIQARVEYLNAYVAGGYGDVELTPKIFLDSGREANVYLHGDNVIKHYTRSIINGISMGCIFRGVCSEEAVDGAMVADMLVTGNPDFEQMIGASYADRKRVYNYIDGLSADNPKHRISWEDMEDRYSDKIKAISCEMARLGLASGDFELYQNVIYRSDNRGPVAIDLTMRYLPLEFCYR